MISVTWIMSQDTFETWCEPWSDPVKCRDFIKLIDGQGNKDVICGRAFPGNTLFFAEVGNSHQSKTETPIRKSIWYSVRTKNLNVKFKSDEVLRNFGASISFKCSDSAETEDDSSNGKKWPGSKLYCSTPHNWKMNYLRHRIWYKFSKVQWSDEYS